jgi:hypothetical protein
MMLELSPKEARSAVKQLKARIQEIGETRITPADDYWHELLDSDWEAARTFGELSGRAAAVREIEDLWRQIGHLNDALKGRRPRDVTLN